MPLITGRARVLDVLAAAAERHWVLPAFNSENLTTTEAVLVATKEHGERLGTPRLPIIVDITNTYWHRPQARHYTHSRDWRVGLRLFLADLRVLTDPGSPYADLDVLVHLDHIQWDTDEELLGWDLGQFSSIMFDASTLPIAENIRRTAAFVERQGRTLLIEGACDEVQESGAAADVVLTSPELADRYHRATGVDLLVANLGTEHRAAAATLRYHGELARAITARVGPRLCLHGTSSVAPEQVRRLFEDGVRRVNLWTALERDSASVLFRELLRHAAKIVGPTLARQWVAAGLLGAAADQASAAAVSHYPTLYRQDLVFAAMKQIVREYLELWYV